MKDAIVTWNEFFEYQYHVFLSGRLDEVAPQISHEARQRSPAYYKGQFYQHPPTRYFLRCFNLFKGEYIFISTPARYEKKALYVLTNYRFIFQDTNEETVVIPLKKIRTVEGRRGLWGVHLTFHYHDNTEETYRINLAPGVEAFRSVINDKDWERLPAGIETYFGFRKPTDPVPPIKDPL